MNAPAEHATTAPHDIPRFAAALGTTGEGAGHQIELWRGNRGATCHPSSCCYHRRVTNVAPDTVERIRRIAASARGLRMLILFGSRARGDAHARSDWDFGYLAIPAFDSAALTAGLVEALDTDAVDLVDLDRAGGLLRYRAARDAHLMFEAEARLWERFRLEAVHFWCDAGPILERGYGDVLASLPQ